MRVFILLLVSGFLFVAAKAQKQGQALTDSLLTEIPLVKNDSVRARIYNKTVLYYRNVNRDSALKYAGLGMALVRRMHWSKGIASFHNGYGLIFEGAGNFDSAFNRYSLAMEIYEQIKDSINTGIAANNLGGIAKAKSDLVKAGAYFTRTLELGSQLNNNYLIGLGSENMALILLYQKDYEKGLGYARQSLAAYQADDADEMIPNALESMGTFFLRLKKYDSSLICYNLALAKYRKNGNRVLEATLLNDLAQYASDKQDYKSAVEYALSARKIWMATDSAYEDAINNKGILGYYYWQLAVHSNPSPAEQARLLKMAKSYLQEVIQECRKSNNKTSEAEFAFDLSGVNQQMGDYKAAYTNAEQAREIQDSLFSQENKNKIAAEIGRLEMEKKNAELTISQMTLVGERRKRFFLIAVLFLISLAGLLLYRQNTLRRRTNRLLDEANNVKIRFFGILSHDLRAPVANLINFLELQKKRPGLLNPEQIGARENKISESAKSLLETMETMLLWSKSQMEHFNLELADFPVGKVFDKVKKTFANIEPVRVIFEGGADLILHTDENYLLAIMQNLTANAVSAVQDQPAGFIIWKAAQNGNKIFLTLSDNGPGIKAEQLQSLHEGSPVSASRHGFGLHMIRDLAKMIHCDISVTQKPGLGTDFILQLL